MSRKLSVGVGAVVVLAGASSAMADLKLWATRTSDGDLALSGDWGAVPAGETRYVTREALAALPGVKTVTDRVWPTADPVEMTILPLTVLWAALEPDADADGIVLTCGDRWESWMPLSLLEAKGPYLILYYDGRAPVDEGGWPAFLGIEPMAPYYAFVSPTEHPDFVDATPFGMISATQIWEHTAANETERYAPFFTGGMAELAGPAAKGGELFLARCNNCHQGADEVGGNVSQRPFVILQAHATLNADYFVKMVTDPKQFYPETIMPRHLDLTAEDFDALIAFMAATKAVTSPVK